MLSAFRDAIRVAVLAILLAGCAATHPGSGASSSTRPRPASISPPLDDPGGAAGQSLYVDEQPRAVHTVEPRPAPSGTGGTVTLLARIGQDGRVQDVHVSKSIPELDSLAIEAVRQWVFKPGKVKGKPVETWVTVPVSFKPR